MQKIIKSALISLIKSNFKNEINDEFVDLISLSTDLTVRKIPKASKTGTYSFKVVGKNSNYKLYGCFNQEWKKQILQATKNLVGNKIAIPKILAHKGKYILAEWIESQDIRSKLSTSWNQLHESIVRYQASIHNAEILSEKITPVSYIDSFLVPRFKKFAAKYIHPEVLDSFEKFIDNETKQMSSYRIRISHPDLTPYNLVETDEGLVVIDNETLHFSSLWQYDIINTAEIVYEPLGLKEKYLESCLKYTDLSSIYQHRQFWELIWLVRLAGSKLQAGEKEVGLECINRLIERITSIDPVNTFADKKTY